MTLLLVTRIGCLKCRQLFVTIELATHLCYICNWQASIPTEAFESVWTDDCRRTWYTKLYSSSSVGDLLQVFACVFVSMYFAAFSCYTWTL